MEENPNKFEFQSACLTQWVWNWNTFCFYEPVLLKAIVSNFIQSRISHQNFGKAKIDITPFLHYVNSPICTYYLFRIFQFRHHPLGFLHHWWHHKICFEFAFWLVCLVFWIYVPAFFFLWYFEFDWGKNKLYLNQLRHLTIWLGEAFLEGFVHWVLQNLSQSCGLEQCLLWVLVLGAGLLRLRW